MMQAQGSPLVQGASPAAQAPVRLRVLRAFLMGGKRQEVGAIALVPRNQVAELLFQRRAERVPEAAAPAASAAPPAPDTTPTARPARRGQESSDAA